MRASPFLLTACAVAVLASGVVAQTPPSAPVTAPGLQPSPATAGQPLPTNRWTDQQIRDAFQLADADGDGVLTRAEAQHLPMMPVSFETSDVNKDGVLDLGEYLNAFRVR